jgi:hypothetical protein
VQEKLLVSMTPPDTHGRGGRGRALCALALAIVLWTLPAAGTDVYYSPNDDGQPAGGAPTIPAGGTQDVALYLDGGAASSAPSSACHDGDGDEVCGFVVTLTGLAGLTISSFTPDGGADLVVDQSAGQIVINGLDPVSPTPGPQRIGSLAVNAATGGSLELTSGEVIGADLGSEVLAQQTVVSVPEPAALAMWVAGTSLLVAIARGRARR